MNEELLRDLIVGSPLARHLGIVLDLVEVDRARVTLPFAEHNVTIADTVHGGAISTLIDTAATAAAWATEQVPENLRGTTVSLTVNFLSGGRGKALTADARVIKRGKSLCYLEVDVADETEAAIAKGLVTYKLG